MKMIFVLLVFAILTPNAHAKSVSATKLELTQFKEKLSQIPPYRVQARLRLAQQYTNDLIDALNVTTEDVLGADFPVVVGWGESALTDSEPAGALDQALARRLEQGQKHTSDWPLKFLDRVGSKRAANIFATALETAVSKNRLGDIETVRFYLMGRFTRDLNFFLRALEQGSPAFSSVFYGPFHHFRDPKIVPHIVERAESEDMNVRWWAADRLGQYRTPTAIAKLQQMAQSDVSPAVRDQANAQLIKYNHWISTCNEAY